MSEALTRTVTKIEANPLLAKGRRLETQAKKNARPHVKALTGVDNYDAHQEQLKDICNQIHYRSYSDMKERVENISTCPDDMPSTNILTLLENLESEDTSWIDDINKELFAEG